MSGIAPKAERPVRGANGSARSAADDRLGANLDSGHIAAALDSGFASRPGMTIG
jgi:hypothetical protein